LFLTFDGQDYQFVAALNKNTGEVLWVTLRDGSPALEENPGANGAFEREKAPDRYKSFATPTIIEYQGKRQLISPGAWTTYSYDPTTGEENWRFRLGDRAWNVQGRPVYGHDLVFFTSGIDRRLAAVRPDGTGDVTDTHLVWDATGRAPKIPSPVIIGDMMFMVSESGGTVTCVEAKTGERVWRERLPAGGAYWASPVYADGRIYFANTQGVVSVIAATRDFQLLAENRFELEGLPEEGALDPEALNNGRIDGGGRTQLGFIASPAIAGDAIILRSDTYLFCVAKR
jgi:outer membrane protein assembly factor BamB